MTFDPIKVIPYFKVKNNVGQVDIAMLTLSNHKKTLTNHSAIVEWLKTAIFSGWTVEHKLPNNRTVWNITVVYMECLTGQCLKVGQLYKQCTTIDELDISLSNHWTVGVTVKLRYR